jgi:hypothetical protein
MPSHLTRRPSGTIPLHNSALPAAGQAHRRRGRARGGKQVRERGGSTRVWLNRSGGSDGEASGDGRWRGSGSAAAAARVAVKCRRC